MQIKHSFAPWRGPHGVFRDARWLYEKLGIEDSRNINSVMDDNPKKYPVGMIAFTGYAKCGKDTAAEALIALGYNRVAFGDAIRRRLVTLNPFGALACLGWMLTPEAHRKGANWNELRKTSEAFLYYFTHAVDPFCGQSEEKEKIRPILEWLGMFKYEECLRETMKAAYSPCVNTRLMRVEEAQKWRRRGGILIEVVRPGVEPATQFEYDQLQRLRQSGLISCQIINGTTTKNLWWNTLSIAGFYPNVEGVRQINGCPDPDTRNGSLLQ